MNQLYITILTILTLFSCTAQEANENVKSTSKSTFCTNELELLSGGDTLSTISLDFNQVKELMYKQIENSFSNTDDLGVYIFSIPYNFEKKLIDSISYDAKLKVIVEKPMASGCILFRQRIFEILVNASNQMMIEAEIGDYNFLRDKLELHYDDTSRGYEKFISIQWDDKCDKNDFQKIFSSIIDGYLNAASKYALEKFGSQLCDLNSEQLSYIKKRTPLEIILHIVNTLPPPPPPPAPPLNNKK